LEEARIEWGAKKYLTAEVDVFFGGLAAQFVSEARYGTPLLWRDGRPGPIRDGHPANPRLRGDTWGTRFHRCSEMWATRQTWATRPLKKASCGKDAGCACLENAVGVSRFATAPTMR
jgi:hypothetical protein